jgi:nucleotide-binding universal stress UspA family protein
MYNKILVPLDGSKTGECTLAHVKDIAMGCGMAEVVLLTVTESYDFFVQYETSLTQMKKEVEEKEKSEEQARQKALTYLNTLSDNLKKNGLYVKTEVITKTDNQGPAEVILDYALNNMVDLIVIATHGRSGITRWAFGSVAEKVVRHSTVPVLTITPTGCRQGR